MNESQFPQATLSECPDCECELVEGRDRMGYEFVQCPGCAKWARLSWDELRGPPAPEVDDV